MGRASLYREGARLPEQLSRLLFLEPVLQGRRVLEVGATSDAVARFLLELGAQRVVCASTDKDVVEALRANCQLDHVDFRLVRPGVLPGDDGAFDLVIDFSLADALAAGDTFRLTDMARLLSRDGFAITSIESQSVRGLGALLGQARSGGPVASSRSAAGLSAAPGPVGYRQLLDALKLQFDLVQVYFQSLLLGYLFGSFDVEPTGDGVSPATALMGQEAEPAGHYLFAFGNAVPVIEDVALVQVPFADLLLAIGRGPPDADATITPTPIAPAAELPAQPTPSTADDEPRGEPRSDAPAAPNLDDEEVRELRREHAAQAQALSHIAVRTEELRVEITQLLTALDARTRERDELLTLAEGLEAAVAARDAQLDEAKRALIELAAAAEAGGADAARISELLDERQRLIEEIARIEGERSALTSRARDFEGAHGELHRRIAALEQALEAHAQERQALTDALEDLARTRDAEKKHAVHQLQALEDAATAQAGQLQALHVTLDEAREAAIQARHEADLRAQEIAKLRVIEERARMLEGELDETRQIALRAHTEAIGKQELKVREEELSDALLKADQRVRELESEAQKLADGVKVLVAEREDARRQLDNETARLTSMLDRERDEARAMLADLSQRRADSEAAAREATEELRSAHERLEALTRDGEGKEKRLKAAHAALEEARRDLVGAREGLQEVAGQRDTLQQVMRARERELEAARQQLLDAAGEARRIGEQLDVQQRALAEARDRLAAAELERVQSSRRADEHGARALEREQDLAALRVQFEAARADTARALQQLEDANRRLLVAEEDGIALLSRLDEEERARAAAEARALQVEREMVAKILSEQAQVAAAEDARRALADELVAARATIDDERTKRHADALSQQEAVAAALAEAEQGRRALQDEIHALEQRHAMRDAEIESLRAVLDEAHATFDRERAKCEILDATLLEVQAALHGERARADLMRATLEEAQGTLLRERANAELQRDALHEARSLLDVERARGDLFSEEIAEAQLHIVALRERMRATLVRVQVDANSATDAQGARADLQHELLVEAQEQLAMEAARAKLLEGELEDARSTFSRRRAELDAMLESERARAAAAQLDAESARERIKVLEDAVTRMAAVATERDAERSAIADAESERIASLEKALAEEKSNAMLLQASVEKQEALADSAVRERDAVLGDLTSHQARANAESQRRQSIEEELAKLRVAHNQALAEVQRLKLDDEAEKRAAVPELEAEIASLKGRVESLEKAAEQREAKITEQTDLISRLKDRLVRIQDQA